MIIEKVKEYRKTAGAVLLDVREPDEYEESHISGAVNFPLSQISDIASVFKDKDQKFYIYCRSGKRSKEAVYYMEVMGYTNLEVIGGYRDYTPTINDKMEEFAYEENAVLVDVREPDEFAEKHIPGAVNIPLSIIREAPAFLKDKDQTIYVYCSSGKRSKEAVYYLGVMGYKNASVIGGIRDYTGETEA